MIIFITKKIVFMNNILDNFMFDKLANLLIEKTCGISPIYHDQLQNFGLKIRQDEKTGVNLVDVETFQQIQRFTKISMIRVSYNLVATIAAIKCGYKASTYTPYQTFQCIKSLDKYNEFAYILGVFYATPKFKIALEKMLSK